MKRSYESPVFELVTLEVSEVLTLSSHVTTGNGENDNDIHDLWA